MRTVGALIINIIYISHSCVASDVVRTVRNKLIYHIQLYPFVGFQCK